MAAGPPCVLVILIISMIGCLSYVPGTKGQVADSDGDGQYPQRDESTDLADNLEQTGAIWPLQSDAYGDISSVAMHPAGELFILHRGTHRWTEKTFNESNFYQQFDFGPITEDVLTGLDDTTGQVLNTWGRNRFYLPHGLTIDLNGNFWITDVALHQVFKIDPNSLEVALSLGTAGVPGSDKDHFCKPTDVAVASDGSFFVADGYCNSRIIKYSADGKYLMEFGGASTSGQSPTSKDPLNIPHSLALVESYDLICVANREGEKIECFSAGIQSATQSSAGKFVLQIAHPSLSRVFAIHYSPAVNRLYAVSGIGFSLEDKPVQIFSIDLENNQVSSWHPADVGVSLTAPHDLTVSNDGQFIYVADLASKPTLWKFDNGDFKSSTKNSAL